MSDIFNGRSDESSSADSTTTTITESILVRSILRVPGGSPSDFTVHLPQPYTNVTSISMIDNTFDFSSLSTIENYGNHVSWHNQDLIFPPGNYPTLKALMDTFMTLIPEVELAYDPLLRRVSYRSDTQGILNFAYARLPKLFGFYGSDGVTNYLQYCKQAPLAATRSIGLEMSDSTGAPFGTFNIPNPTPVASTTVVPRTTFDKQTFTVPKMTLDDFRVVLSYPKVYLWETTVVLNEWEMTLEITCMP